MGERAGRGEARESTYDVVVVGAGMGGLTAAALLARAGKKVVVVDDQERPGGHAHAIRHDGYTFDSAVHLITRSARTDRFGVGVVDATLRRLGVREGCELLPVGDPFYTVHLPGLTLSVPTGRDAYLAAHLRHFPGEERGLRRLVDLGTRIATELASFPERPGLLDAVRARWRFPTMLRYRGATMQQVIDRELHDPRLKAAYGALWHWTGSLPSRASFLAWASMMAHYIEGGAYYVRGGYQSLADAVAAALQRAGGELVLGRRVDRIETSRGRVQAVWLDSGQHIAAPVVISNGDPRVTFRDLLQDGRVPGKYIRMLRRLEPSISAVAGYVATDLDVRALGVDHENLLSTSLDVERSYAEARAGGVPTLSLHVPTITDPSLAPAGQHIVILMAVAPADPSLDVGLDEGILSLAETVLPGLRDHITAVAPVGPAGRSGLALRRMDAIYGAALTPDQIGLRRPGHHTPVTGLHLVGQWTRPGPGVPWVMESGIKVARTVLGLASVDEVVPLHLTPAFAG